MFKSLEITDTPTYQPWITDILKLRKINFSTKKVNIIIGPNGSGKTSISNVLRIFSFTYFYNSSILIDRYVNCDHKFKLFDEGIKFWREPVFMPGYKVDTDFCESFFYRPGFIIGEELNIAHAMCMGFNGASEFGNKIKNKSSGQKSTAILNDAFSFIDTADSHVKHVPCKWSFGNINQLSKLAGSMESKAETIMKLISNTTPTLPTVIFDEPEQSLDMRSQIEFWDKISKIDTSKIQVIIITHSPYPLLYKTSKYNFIETEPGYKQSLLSMLKNN